MSQLCLLESYLPQLLASAQLLLCTTCVFRGCSSGFAVCEGPHQVAVYKVKLAFNHGQPKV